MQVLIVGQQGMRLSTKEVAIPGRERFKSVSLSNDNYQMPRTARITGRLDSMGAVRKWLSIQWAPDSSSMKLSYPMCRAIVIPMADHRLYLRANQGLRVQED